MLLKYPDPFLRTVSSPVESIGYTTNLLVERLFDTMYVNNALGVSAIQIGVPQRIFVMNAGDGGPMTFINPEIIESSPTLSTMEEGCLSFENGFYVSLSRPDSVIIKYVDQNGNPQEYQAVGLEATVIQHEMDHLNGILMAEK